jgi:flagellar capping protein FliD
MRFAEALNSAMEALRNRAGIPNTPVDNSPLGRQIKLLNDRIEATQERLKQREAAYYARFVALEQLIGQANVQSLWLAQQFGGWS